MIRTMDGSVKGHRQWMHDISQDRNIPCTQELYQLQDTTKLGCTVSEISLEYKVNADYSESQAALAYLVIAVGGGGGCFCT